MCMMGRAGGFLALIPVTVLLTLSFFVLFGLRQIKEQGLKVFGYIITVLLWVCALVVLTVGLYVATTGRPPFRCPMMEMMSDRRMMMQGDNPAMGQGRMPLGCADMQNTDKRK